MLQNHPKTWSYFWLENRCGFLVSQFDTHWATTLPIHRNWASFHLKRKKNKKSWHTPPLLSKIIPNTAVSNPFWLFSFQLLRTITFSELKTKKKKASNSSTRWHRSAAQQLRRIPSWNQFARCDEASMRDTNLNRWKSSELNHFLKSLRNRRIFSMDKGNKVQYRYSKNVVTIGLYD